MNTVLLTGGTGYIGSHTALELLKADLNVVIVDNLSNSEETVVERIKEAARQAGVKKLPNVSFYKEDCCNCKALSKIFKEDKIDSVIHFAGFKAVGESVSKPVMYYQNNINSTLSLLNCMNENGCKNIIFSSSATVYGDGNPPYSEDSPTSLKEVSNPYGKTKYMIEEIITDSAKAFGLKAVLLRYFNPIGADPSGLLGEKPNGIPNNLLPYVTQTAHGIREKLTVYGNDYPTPDGSCIRDYIHVVDLAKGHLAALSWMEKGLTEGKTEVFNLGTGKGTSVLEMIEAFQKATGIQIPFVVGPRRPGDLPVSYAVVTKAQNILGWKATKTIEEGCRDSWHWECH